MNNSRFKTLSRIRFRAYQIFRQEFSALPFLLFLVFSFVSASSRTQSQSTALALDNSNTSFKYEVKRAINRGLEYLSSVQNEAGWWSTQDHPALTALALQHFWAIRMNAIKTSLRI